MKTTFKSVIELLDEYKDNDKCVKLLELQRWNGKPKCPHCGYDEKIYRTNRGYRCANKGCCKKFTVTTGTICESSHIHLRYWFAAIYLLTAHKKGISSHQLARDLGITQKSAWFLNHRVREMLKENEPGLLDGEIEVDESFFGGKAIPEQKHMINKTSTFFDWLDENEKKIILPTPIITEILVPIDDENDRQKFMSIIYQRFRIAPLDDFAAQRAGEIWNKYKTNWKQFYQEGDDGLRNKFKYDILILGIALAQKVECFYTEDDDLLKLAIAAGLNASKIPVTGKQGKLL